MTALRANKSYYTPSVRLLDWITRIHRGLYRATGGVLGATLLQFGEKGSGYWLRPLDILLLTTTGRKSGVKRTAPLPYIVYDGRTFLVGSFAGSDKHPAWYLNLCENPEVDVQIGPKRRTCRAITLEGAPRDRYWQRVTDDWPRYRVYQAATERTIPLVELR